MEKIKQEKTEDATTHKFNCPWCPYKPKYKKVLDQHMRTHTGERPYKCPHPKCPASFTTRGHLRVHEVVHTKEKRFECLTCHKKFNRQSTLWTHQRGHEDNAPKFACTLCQYVTNGKGSLKKHVVAIHSDLKPFKCGQCGYRGKTKQYLDQHLKVHLAPEQKEKVKTIPCPKCPLKFFYQSALRSHFRSHSGLKPFACPHNCDYKATQSAKLREHIARVHTKEKRMKCKFCDYSTFRRSDLNRHVRAHIREKPYKCAFNGCQFETDSPGHLRRHEDGVHLKLRPFKCSQCGYVTSENGNLKRHVRIHHSSLSKGDLEKKIDNGDQ